MLSFQAQVVQERRSGLFFVGLGLMRSSNERTIKHMKSRIWRALLCASDQEIHEGMHFYPGAYGLCRFLGRVFGVSTETCAGLYAALSPMNTWDCNVSNIVDVLRWRQDQNTSLVFSSPIVNSPNINREKAIRIALGDDPLYILRGHKVRAFYHCIANPNDHTPMVIDRHLINLALGVIPNKSDQSTLANSLSLIADISTAYDQLARREKLGNRLASIAWFVQRRIERTGQIPMPHPDSPVCCGRPMRIHGRVHAGRRFVCNRCSVVRKEPTLTIDGYRLGTNHDRTIIYLRDHPWSNKWGWQYLARYRIAKSLDRLLLPDEHAHHIDLDKTNDNPRNLELQLSEHHGRFHARVTTLAEYRDDLGRFVEQDKGNDNDRYDEVPF